MENAATRICIGCRKERPCSSFESWVDKRSHNAIRFRSRCCDCMREYDRQRWPIIKARLTAEQRQRASAATQRGIAKKKAAGLCTSCGRPKDGKNIQCSACTKKWNLRNVQKNAALKEAAFAAYGGSKCSCKCGCSETHREVLTIDHIFGRKEAEHPKPKELGGVSLYRWLKKNGYPQGYRVLCMNCNFALGHFGYCPHEIERSTMKESGDVLPARAEDHAPMYVN